MEQTGVVCEPVTGTASAAKISGIAPRPKPGSARPITILARIIPLDLDHTMAAVPWRTSALVPRRNYGRTVP